MPARHHMPFLRIRLDEMAQAHFCASWVLLTGALFAGSLSSFEYLFETDLAKLSATLVLSVWPRIVALISSVLLRRPDASLMVTSNFMCVVPTKLPTGPNIERFTELPSLKVLIDMRTVYCGHPAVSVESSPSR